MKIFPFFNITVQEWVVNTGRESTVKSFLRGHQKSGPFLEDNDSAIRVKRLSGLKSISSKDKLQVVTKSILSIFLMVVEFEYPKVTSRSTS